MLIDGDITINLMPRTETLRVGFDIDSSIGRLADGASGLGMDAFSGI